MKKRFQEHCLGNRESASCHVHCLNFKKGRKDYKNLEIASSLHDGVDGSSVW